jgi:hypothetical protein
MLYEELGHDLKKGPRVVAGIFVKGWGRYIFQGVGQGYFSRGRAGIYFKG